MTYKQRETSREIRLWLTQIAIPITTTVVTICAIPEARTAVVNKAKEVKEKASNMFQKKKRA